MPVSNPLNTKTTWIGHISRAHQAFALCDCIYFILITITKNRTRGEKIIFPLFFFQPTRTAIIRLTRLIHARAHIMFIDFFWRLMRVQKLFKSYTFSTFSRENDQQYPVSATRPIETFSIVTRKSNDRLFRDEPTIHVLQSGQVASSISEFTNLFINV